MKKVSDSIVFFSLLIIQNKIKNILYRILYSGSEK